MRYTRIGPLSYGIAAVLVATVVGVARARSGAPAAPGSTQPSGPSTAQTTPEDEGGVDVRQVVDSAAWQAECSGCHGAGEARGRSIPALRGLAVELFASEGGRDYLIDFMLDGRVRSVEDGQVVYAESHPSYESLPDSQIAGILNYVLNSWGNDALMPAERRLYGEADIAARRGEP